MVLTLSVLFSIIVSAPAFAAMICSGDAGVEWRLKLDNGRGLLDLAGRTEMDVMLDTPAEGPGAASPGALPRALTLIGARDSAILLLSETACRSGAGTRGYLMTQRGQTPILLVGCCEETADNG